MRLPDWFEFVVLALAAYRLTRLAGWDEFPLAARVRAWVIGERWIAAHPEQDVPLSERIHAGYYAEDVTLPGKTPESENVEEVRPAYDRPTLAHLVHCPFCMGWWISLAVYCAWLAAPRPTLYVMLPFALSALVGLTAKNLDP